MFKAFKCQIWLTNTKLFFWESEANVETLQKPSLYIGICHKFVLKSEKSLNRILWATEYWFKALKCQIWLTNTKLFFWESKSNLKTLQNPCLYIWVSYKFVLKSEKSLNRILWATEYWFKALKCQIWLANTKPFFWESEANVKTLQKPSSYIWFSYKFVLKSGEHLSWLWLLLFRNKRNTKRDHEIKKQILLLTPPSSLKDVTCLNRIQVILKLYEDASSSKINFSTLYNFH